MLCFAGICFATFISNADILDEDMADITDWTDGDSGTGVSSQATFDSKSCMKLDTGANHSTSNFSKRTRDVGTFGARTVFSINLYIDAGGTFSNDDDFNFIAFNGTNQCQIYFASDGVWVFDGATYNKITGSDAWIIEDAWQEWTLDVNWTTLTVDVYLNQVLKASGIDCSASSVNPNGLVWLYQYGKTTSNRISYIDWFKAGSDFVPDPTPPNVVLNGTVHLNGNVKLQ